MKKIIIVLLSLALLGAIGYIFYPKTPQFVDIKMKSLPNFTQDQITIDGEAQFMNPNNFGITLQGHDIEVSIKGIQIGELTQKEEQKIAANTAFAVPVKLSFKKSDVFQSDDLLLQAAITIFGGEELKIRFKGMVNIQVLGFIKIPMPIDYSESILKYLNK
jgi:LEA14-like dessication related protein